MRVCTVSDVLDREMNSCVEMISVYVRLGGYK